MEEKFENKNLTTVETAHGSFTIDTKRDKKIYENLERGVYHQEDTLELLSGILNASSVFVDIGAHIGTLAIPLSKIASKTVAFEPVPATFDLLVKNTKHFIRAMNSNIFRHPKFCPLNAAMDRPSWELS